MSALPPKADMVQRGRDVRFVPKADSRAAAIFYCYSISRSARPTSGSVLPGPSMERWKNFYRQELQV
jgi:hypothetical protein